MVVLLVIFCIGLMKLSWESMKVTEVVKEKTIMIIIHKGGILYCSEFDSENRVAYECISAKSTKLYREYHIGENDGWAIIK